MSAAKSRNPTTTTAEQLRAEIIAAVTAEGAEIGEATRKAHQRIQQAQAEHDVELDTWRSEVAAARRDRVAEPPQPEPPDTSGERSLLSRLQDDRGKLVDKRSAAMRSNAERVEAGWAEARTGLSEQAREALEALRPVLAEVQDWLTLIRETRTAVDVQPNRRALNGASTRTPQGVQLADLIPLADGADVLAPTPLPPQRQPLGEGASEDDVFHGRQRQRNLAGTDPRRFL